MWQWVIIAIAVLLALAIIAIVIALFSRRRSSPSSHFLDEERASQRRAFTPLASQELTNDMAPESIKPFKGIDDYKGGQDYMGFHDYKSNQDHYKGNLFVFWHLLEVNQFNNVFSHKFTL